MRIDSRVLRLVGDVHGLLDLDEFRLGLIDAIRREIRSDWVSMNEIGPRPEDTWSLVVPDNISQRNYDDFARLAHENPLVRHFEQTGDGGAYRLSDVCTRQEFHSLELYRVFYSQVGMEHQIAFILPHPPDRLLGVSLNRKRGNFTDTERALLNRARPFLIQQYNNAIEYTAARDAASRGRGAAMVDGLRGAGLTEREADMMRLVALGRSNADAAGELGVSVRTAQKHVERAFRKLGVRTRSQAAVRAWELSG